MFLMSNTRFFVGKHQDHQVSKPQGVLGRSERSEECWELQNLVNLVFSNEKPGVLHSKPGKPGVSLCFEVESYIDLQKNRCFLRF